MACAGLAEGAARWRREYADGWPVSSRPQLVVDSHERVGGQSVAERRIRDASNYINKRITNLKAGEAWFDIGRELSELKAFLKKTSKTDTKRGWLAAFKSDNLKFPFKRTRAEQLILVYERIGATGVAPINLPASAHALIALVKLPDSHLKQSIEMCSPATTEADVRKIAKKIGVPEKKKTTKHKAKAACFDELYEPFRVSLKAMPKERRIKELKNLCHDLGISILEPGND